MQRKANARLVPRQCRLEDGKESGHKEAKTLRSEQAHEAAMSALTSAVEQHCDSGRVARWLLSVL